MAQMVWELKSHSDPTLALRGGAFLDRALEEILSAIFIPISKDDLNKMFNTSQAGFLSAFGAKATLAHALGFLGPKTQADLTRLNDIRIVFAHTLYAVDFQNELIIKDCESLELYKDSCLFHGGPQNITEARDLFAHTVAIIYGILVHNASLMRERKPVFNVDVSARDLAFALS
jgi:hypothetical protein